MKFPNIKHDNLINHIITKSISNQSLDLTKWWSEHSLLNVLINLITSVTKTPIRMINYYYGTLSNEFYVHKSAEEHSPFFSTVDLDQNKNMQVTALPTSAYNLNDPYSKKYITQDWNPMDAAYPIGKNKVTVIPVNQGNSHWMLAVIIDDKKILFNSFGGASSGTQYQHFINAGFTIIPTGLQTNGYSCGDFTILFAYLAVSFPEVFKKGDPEEIKNLTNSYINKVGGLQALRVIFMMLSLSSSDFETIKQTYPNLMEMILNVENAHIQALDSTTNQLLNKLGIKHKKEIFNITEIAQKSNNNEDPGFEFLSNKNKNNQTDSNQNNEDPGFEFLSDKNKNNQANLNQNKPVSESALNICLKFVQDRISCETLQSQGNHSSNFLKKLNPIREIKVQLNKTSEYSADPKNVWLNIVKIANDYLSTELTMRNAFFQLICNLDLAMKNAPQYPGSTINGLITQFQENYNKELSITSNKNMNQFQI